MKMWKTSTLFQIIMAFVIEFVLSYVIVIVIAAVIANSGMTVPRINYNIFLQAMEKIKLEQKNWEKSET